MPEVALAGYAVLLVVAFGWRSWVQRRRTGSTGFKGVTGRPGSLEWLGGVLFVVALLAGAAAPVLALTGVVPAVDALDSAVLHGLGAGLFVAGLAGTLWAQGAMGDSWRIGVDDAETPRLVTSGPFAIVRNPVFAALLPAAVGLALMVASGVAVVAALALLTAVQLQVRLVEEPYLLARHGDAYAAYAAAVGRFVPGVGRLRDRAVTAA